jgi:phage-related protein
VIRILPRCKKEIADFPDDVRGEIADAAARLEAGHLLSMPLSRPMQSIAKGCHELRFRDRSGVYRVIYVFVRQREIWFLHAFRKKTEKTSEQNLQAAKLRLREVL